jgi:hypothetical protein
MISALDKTFPEDPKWTQCGARSETRRIELSDYVKQIIRPSFERRQSALVNFPG